MVAGSSLLSRVNQIQYCYLVKLDPVAEEDGEAAGHLHARRAEERRGALAPVPDVHVSLGTDTE